LYLHQDPVQHQQFSLDTIPLKSQSQLPCPQIPGICRDNKKIARWRTFTSYYTGTLVTICC
jgi:hypothetical protein